MNAYVLIVAAQRKDSPSSEQEHSKSGVVRIWWTRIVHHDKTALKNDSLQTAFKNDRTHDKNTAIYKTVLSHLLQTFERNLTFPDNASLKIAITQQKLTEFLFGIYKQPTYSS